MHLRRIAFLAVLILLPAARASAQDDRELYHAEVCNEGRIAVEVAVAYKDWGFSDPFWIVDYWYRVPAGECKLVFSHFYAPNNWLSFQSFPLHLAFAFTDSTGVWGAARVRPPGRIAASSVKLCVGKSDYEYRVDGATPQAGNCPSGMLIPASIDWEPTQGAIYQEYVGYGRPMSFSVALGPSDRAIPFGGPGSSTPTTLGPGTEDQFAALLRSTLNALPYSQVTVGPGGYVQVKPGYRQVFTCVDPMVGSKESLSNLQTARAKALTAAIKKFLAAHSRGLVRFRVTELNGILAVAQTFERNCVNSGAWEFVHQSPEAGAASVPAQPSASKPASPPPKPASPAPKPAPAPDTTSGGFGDLIGEGGFIKPLPK